MKKVVTKKMLQYWLYTVLSVVLIASSSTMSAERLANKFFPADAPILANSYPNDFLPWGVGLFLFLGFVFPNLLMDWLSGKQKDQISYVISMTIALSMFVLSWVLWTEGENSWGEYFVILLSPWSISWGIGSVFAYFLRRLLFFVVSND